MSFVEQFEPDESLLTLKASKMDLDAFNLLVLKYQNLVYYHAYALLGDPYTAEDATQESFIKAFRHMGNFRGGAFRPWILKITTNTCYDKLRKSNRFTQSALFFENEYGEEQDSPAWVADPAASVQTAFEQKELSENLYHMIDELPSNYRSALTLVDVYEMDYATAAQILKVPLGTLKSRLTRARFLMRNKLFNHVDHPSTFSTTLTASMCA
jgi:RNA polymerase sigma-70 factor (ECF subfamily)